MNQLEQLSENEYRFVNTGTRSAGLDVSMASSINSSNKFNIAVDCDEVLVDTATKWINNLRKDPMLLPYFTEYHHAVADINGNLRSEYYYDKWLGVTDKEHFNKLLSIYFDDGTFYDDLPPLPYYSALRASIPVLDTVHILTKCGHDLNAPNVISKKRFLLRLFADFQQLGTNVHFHFITNDTSKGQYLVDNNISVNSFVDDQVSNHENVLETTYPTSNIELMVPLYGFNMDVFERLKKFKGERSFKAELFHNFTDISVERYKELVAQFDLMKDLN